MGSQPTARQLASISSHLIAQIAVFHALLSELQHEKDPNITLDYTNTLYPHSTAIYTSLSQLQALLLRDGTANNDPKASIVAATIEPDLVAALTTALTGCAVVFACLNADELRQVLLKAKGCRQSGDPASRSWRSLRGRRRRDGEDITIANITGKQPLLRQLNRLRIACALLVRVLLEQESASVRQLLAGAGDLFPQVARGSEELRATWPASRASCDRTEEAEVDNMSFLDAVDALLEYRGAVALATGEDAGGDHHAEASKDLEADASCLPIQQTGQEEVAQADAIVTVDQPYIAAREGAPERGFGQSNTEEETSVAPREQDVEQDEGENKAEVPPLPPRRPAIPSPPSNHVNDSEHSAHQTHEPGPIIANNESSDAIVPTTSPDPDLPTPNSGMAPVHLSCTDLSLRRAWQTFFLTELAHITALSSLPDSTGPFRTRLARDWPQLAPHLDAVLASGRALATVHAHHLLLPLRAQLASVVKTDLILPLFRAWCSKAAGAYRAYCRRCPHALAAVKATCEADAKFNAFVSEGLGVDGGLERWLERPVLRLEEYCDLFRQVEALERESAGEGADDAGSRGRLTRAGQYTRMILRLKESCEKVMKRAADGEELRDIHRRIQSVNYHHVEPLRLLDAERTIVLQGMLACKTKGKGAWNQIHCVLLDNYLFWGRVERPRESWFGKYRHGERLWVLEAPMSVHQLQCSVDNAPSGRSRASIIDNVPRGTELFVFAVNAGGVTHLMAAATGEERQKWSDAISSSPSVVQI